MSKSRERGIEGLEAIDELEIAGLPSEVPAGHVGVWAHIRGRSIYLRGIKRRPRGAWKWLLILGPGLIATSAGNDAGGVATYSAAGAKIRL